MGPRNSLRYLLALLAVCASTGCKSSNDANKAPAGVAELTQRCERLGKACADNDKHAEKVVAGCQQAASAQADKGCTDKAIAAYDCYEKELCTKADKIWAFDDIRVLAYRSGKCVAERDAIAACLGK
jgi:hypothetical protein